MHGPSAAPLAYMHGPLVNPRPKTLVSMQGRLVDDAARLKAHIVLCYINPHESVVRRQSGCSLDPCSRPHFATKGNLRTHPVMPQSSGPPIADDWDFRRDLITRLYRDEDKPLKEIMTLVNVSGFRAT